MQVQKRDNRLVDFNSSKIKTAIQECCKRIQKDYHEETLKVKEHLTEIVGNVCLHLPKNDIVKVEEIQDTVEQELSKVSPQVAKEYIIYRYQRNVARDSKSALTQIYMNLTSKKSSDMDLKRENANINSDTAMGMMLKFGAEASKEFCLNHLIKPKYARMHRNGDIHIHDLDFYPMTFNCSFIPLGKLLKRGFSTGHGHIGEPQTIMCASSLACIILQANQNEMYGGQAYSCWDYDLAPYVAKSYVKILNRLVSTKVEQEVKLNLDGLYEKEGTLFSEVSQGTIIKEVLKYTEHVEYIMKEARELLYKEVRQARQASIHNFNTLQSRAGSQTPFSSVNYGTDTSVEGRMITKAILEETDKGLANGETSIFPVQIFKVQNSKNALEGSPNYDLFKLACKVSAKRLFPNFVYQDSPYNAMYYDGRKETEIAVMGAVRGDETVTIKCGTDIYKDIRIDSAMQIIRNYTKHKAKKSKDSHEFSHKCGVYKITHISGKYYVGSSKNIGRRFNEHKYSIRHYGKLGEIYFLDDYNVDNYKFEVLELCDIDDLWKTESKYINLEDPLIVNYKDSKNNGNFDSFNRVLALNGIKYSDIQLNERATHWNREIDSDCFIMSRGQFVPIRSLIINNEYSPLKLYEVTYLKNSKEYKLHITEDHPLATQRGRVRCDELKVNDCIFDCETFKKYLITNIKVTDEKCFTYDFEVDNDMFDLSGIVSHNCRTRTIQNVHNPEQNVTSGRGNITFTTINLPRLGILAKHDLNKFFKLFDDRIECCISQIYDRFNFISKKKVYNFPFLMQEGVYLDSEKLDNDDEILESLKNGTLAVGFIGLAECLKALIGKHQGESQEAQELGLKIIRHLRDRMDLESKNSKLTWGCFATPAEGLSSRFTKIDQKKFGKIEGVTDRKYYTNSFHVPVYYNTSIVHKLDVEAPYHEICNAGSISYVEMDGDLTKNVEAFEKVVQYAKEKNMCYFSINHPVDVCPVCGYTGVIYDECPKCGFKEGIGTSVKRLEALNCKC